MNLEELKEKIKTDVKFQLIIGGLVFLFLSFFIFKNVLFPKPKKPPHCFGANLTIWFPFEKEKLSSIIEPIERYYCLKINIEEKSLDKINEDFIYSFALKNVPDIIFADNIFVSKNNNFLYQIPNSYKISGLIFVDEKEKFGYPLFIDTLVLFANKEILDFLGKSPPQTLEELNNFIKEFNSKGYLNYYAIGLGSSKVKNKKEIVLVMNSILEKPPSDILETFFSYTNPQNEFFSFKPENQDINMFAEGKLVFYIGFYRDKKEISDLNPRLNFSIYPSPINTFPPKAKNFVKVYYFVIPNESKNKKYALEFLKTLIEKKYLQLAKDYDLIPNKNLPNLSQEKIRILDLAKYGSTYESIILQPQYQDFDKVFDIWENNPEEAKNEIFRLKLDLIER